MTDPEYENELSAPEPARPARIPVLICGGGPVGLALAVELGSRGIECILVEQGDGTVDSQNDPTLHPHHGILPALGVSPAR